MDSHATIDPNDASVIQVIYSSTPCLPTTQGKVVCKTKSDSQKLAVRETIDVIVLSVSFAFAFTTFLSIQNLQSSLNQASGLGVISLSSLYGVCIVSSILTPVLINSLGVKSTILLGWCALCSYTIANFYPSWWTLIPVSCFTGLVFNPLWASQATYIYRRAHNYSNLTGKNLGNTLVKFNGIFYTMYNVSIVVGNLISSVVLNQSPHMALNSSTFHESEFHSTCGADDCPAVNIPLNQTVHVAAAVGPVYTLIGIFTALNLLCILITALFLRPLALTHRQSSRTIIASCSGMLFTDTKLMLVLPLNIAMTVFQAVIFAEFTKSYVTCSLGVSMVGYVIAALGGTAACVAFFQSRVAKYTGRLALVVVATVLQLTVLLGLLWWRPNADQLYVFFVIVIIVGVAEGTYPSQTSSFYSLAFRDKIDQAFTNLNTAKCIGYSLMFALSAFVCTSTKIIIAVVLLILGLSLHITAELLYSAEKVHSQEAGLSRLSDIVTVPVTETLLISDCNKRGHWPSNEEPLTEAKEGL